jgi:serine/threonine-protein kinase
MADPQRLAELGVLLDRALSQTKEEQDGWLADLRRNRPEVASELESLLAAESRLDAENFLHAAPVVTQPASLTGARVGSYTLVRPLGRGGMGSVWLARRSDGSFEGSAAIKLINLALLDAVGRERFRREGQTLARLEHPGIARLLDAGVTAAGVPFLVLDFVDGERIDEYCERHRLSPLARIRLVLQVIAAVAHAHANLVVHRDLKPSNILVTAAGQVKLLDFGIAKLLEAETGRAEHTDLTEQGGGVLTLEYAAPEQVTGGAITTATDVHAIGVLLYLLLTGGHPTARSGATTAERLRALVEAEPGRLGAAVPAATLGIPVGQARRLYAGDLENIVARTLEKDPARRYASMSALGDDLERYLRHEPVEARTPSLRYRAGKFVRRNRVAVGLASAAAIALFATTVVAWSQLIEARYQRDDARVQRDRAVYEGRRSEASNGFMLALLSGLHPGERVSTLELLERARELLEQDHDGDPRFVARMMLDLSDEFGPTVVPGTQRALLAGAASRAVAIDDPELGGLAHCALARLHASAFLSIDSARAHLARGRAAVAASRIALPDVEGRCLLAGARIHAFEQQADSAAELSDRALAAARSSGDTASPAFARFLLDVANLRHQLGRPRAALPLVENAARILRSTGRAHTVQLLNALGHEFAMLEAIDRARSDSVFRIWIRLAEGMGAGFARVVENRSAQHALGIGWPDSAAAIWTDLLQRQKDAGEPTAYTLVWLSRALIDAGRLPEARARFHELERVNGDSLEILQVRGRLAEVEGRHAEALAAYQVILARQGYPSLRFASSFWFYVTRAARMALLSGDAALADSLGRRAYAYALDLRPEDALAAGRIRLIQARARIALADTAGAIRFGLEALDALGTGRGSPPLEPGELEAARDLLATLPRPGAAPLSSSTPRNPG